MTHTRNRVVRFAVVALLLAGSIFALRAEDAPPKLEELFPETTLIAIALPDLEAARKSADASRIGEMLKQPEMREFLDPLITRMKTAFDDAQKLNPMIPTLDDLDKGLLSSEIGICIFSRGVGNQPGVLLSIKPKDEKAFEAILTNATKPIFGGQPLPKEPFPLGDGDQAPGVLFARGRLLVCYPMSDLVTIADRVGDAGKRAQGTLNSAAAFKEAKAGMRESAGWIFANPAGIVQQIEEVGLAQGGPEMMKAKTVMRALGLGSINSVLLGLSFAGGEPAFETYVGIDGAAQGVFSLVGNKPVGKEMLQIAAENAPYVTAGSFNFDQVIPFIRNIVTINLAEILPGGGNHLNQALLQVNGMLGFDIEKDLLGNIDSEFVLTQTPHDTGLPLTFSPGLVGVIKLKDGATVEECLKKFKGFVDAQLQAQKVPGFLGKIRTAEYKGQRIYYFSQLVNISGAMVVTVMKDKLVWGDSLNAVKRGIDQLTSGTNIVSNKSFQTALARVSGKPFDADKLPLSFAYAADFGSGGGVLLLTGLGVVSGTAAVSGLTHAAHQGRELEVPAGPPNPFNEIARQPGLNAAMKIADGLDMNLWPDAEFFVKRRQAHAAVGMRTEKGWFSRTEFPPPSPHYNGMAAAVPIVAAALVVPALVGFRTQQMHAVQAQAIRAEQAAVAEQRAVAGAGVNRAQAPQQQNNLRQISLAISMYEIENNKLPANPADLYPTYINDLNVFKSKTNPEQDVAYTLITGVRSDDADAIIAFENPPENAAAGKRNILKTNGKVESLSEEDFKTALKETEAIVTKAGRKFGTMPMSLKEISKKAKK